MANKRRQAQTIQCGWCERLIALRSTGRMPRWCSDTCRHRAWEQRRAAASGRTAVEIIERIVEVEKPVEVVREVEVEVMPKGARWGEALREFARQLDNGRVYDRDLADMEASLLKVIEAFNRRSRRRR